MDFFGDKTTYNLDDVDRRLGDNYWSPVDVAHINDWALRAAAFKGEFHWHSHQDDELFFVYKGNIIIETKNGTIALHEGEGTVILKGLEHKPSAKERAVVLMLEPIRLASAGD